jgi:hypothetical protein
LETHKQQVNGRDASIVGGGIAVDVDMDVDVHVDGAEGEARPVLPACLPEEGDGRRQMP